METRLLLHFLWPLTLLFEASLKRDDVLCKKQRKQSYETREEEKEKKIFFESHKIFVLEFESVVDVGRG